MPSVQGAPGDTSGEDHQPQWAKHLLEKHAGGDPRRLVERCSKDFVDDALAFELRTPA